MSFYRDFFLIQSHRCLPLCWFWFVELEPSLCPPNGEFRCGAPPSWAGAAVCCGTRDGDHSNVSSGVCRSGSFRFCRLWSVSIVVGPNVTFGPPTPDLTERPLVDFRFCFRCWCRSSSDDDSTPRSGTRRSFRCCWCCWCCRGLLDDSPRMDGCSPLKSWTDGLGLSWKVELGLSWTDGFGWSWTGWFVLSWTDKLGHPWQSHRHRSLPAFARQPLFCVCPPNPYLMM